MPSPEPEIKNHIRRLRFDHGEMTQDQLAKQEGVTRHTIMALEAGKYFPSLLLAFRIARVFGAPVEQVFEYRVIPDSAETLRPRRSRARMASSPETCRSLGTLGLERGEQRMPAHVQRKLLQIKLRGFL